MEKTKVLDVLDRKDSEENDSKFTDYCTQEDWNVKKDSFWIQNRLYKCTFAEASF